jgi:hypothetical protein
MDPNSGKIYSDNGDPELMREYLERGFVEIPLLEIPQVSSMNRHQRRKWAAEQKRSDRKAK